MSIEILSEGKAECIKQPMGSHGLEGYIHGEKYKFQCCWGDFCDEGERYYRVYPNPESYYYENCNPGVFRKYFRVVIERNLVKDLSEGKARCIKEPMGDGGLSCYYLDKEYKYLCYELGGNRRFRIYRIDHSGDYSDCSPDLFVEYFKIITSTSAESDFDKGVEIKDETEPKPATPPIPPPTRQKARQCISHHYACDCRERLIKDTLQGAIEYLGGMQNNTIAFKILAEIKMAYKKFYGEWR